MRPKHLPLLLAFGLLSTSALSQESGLELRFFRPENTDVNALFNLVRELHGRDLVLEDNRHSKNIILGNGAILVHEDKERMAQIANTIAQLDVSHGPDPADFKIEVFQPQKSSAVALWPLANQLFNRGIPAADGGTKNSISWTDGRIIVTELPDVCEAVVAKLGALDRALGAQDPKNATDAMEYTPRAISVQAAMLALQPFTKFSGGQHPPIVHVMNQRGVLILRGAPEDLVQIRELLQRIDKPAPQVMLTAFILTGSDEENGNANEELSAALRDLLPYKSYSVVGSSTIRLAAQPMRQFTMDPTGPRPIGARGQPPVYHLQGTIEAYDPDAPSLTFQHLTATKSGLGGGRGQLFQTATTIYGGEYAVLGVAGGAPEFVVLRMKPIGPRGRGQADRSVDRDPR